MKLLDMAMAINKGKNPELIKQINAELKKMKESERDWKDVAQKERGSGMNVAKLDSQIAQYQKQIAALEKQIAVVSQQRNALNVG